MLTRHKRVYPAQSTRPFPRVAVGKGSGYARLPKVYSFQKEKKLVCTNFHVVGQFYWIVLVREFDNSLVLVLVN